MRTHIAENYGTVNIYNFFYGGCEMTQQYETKTSMAILESIQWDPSFVMLEHLRNWGTRPVYALAEAAVNHLDGDKALQGALCDLLVDHAKALNRTIERLIEEGSTGRREQVAQGGDDSENLTPAEGQIANIKAMFGMFKQKDRARVLAELLTEEV